MLLEFNKIPSKSPVWIFESERNLTDSEINDIKHMTKCFISKWQTHKEDVHGAFEIKYNKFIIISANKDINAPSGCSIDGIFKLIKKIENKNSLNLLNRLTTSYIAENGEIKSCNIDEFKDKVKKNIIKKTTIVFNNTIKEKRELESNWKVEASKSWHKKLFPLK